MALSIKRPLHSIVILLTMSVLALSIYSFYDGIIALQYGSTDYSYQIITGILGTVTSVYMITALMKRLGLSKQTVQPNIVTVIECRKCGFKQIRKFAKEDYVLKNVGNCQKCNEPMLITGIYAEETKKK